MSEFAKLSWAKRLAGERGASLIEHAMMPGLAALAAAGVFDTNPAAAKLHRLAAAFAPRCPDTPARAPLIELSRGCAGIPDRGSSAVLTLTPCPPAAMLKRSETSRTAPGRSAKEFPGPVGLRGPGG